MAGKVHADGVVVANKPCGRKGPSGCLICGARASPRPAPAGSRRKLHHRAAPTKCTAHTRTHTHSHSQRPAALSQEVKVQNQVNLIVEYIGGLPPLCQSRSLSRGRRRWFVWFARTRASKETRERVIAQLTSFLARLLALEIARAEKRHEFFRLKLGPVKWSRIASVAKKIVVFVVLP